MSKRQLAMVIDLNKCLGCHTCSVTCKTLWTSKEGREYMYWNNVETHPGKGYPKDWQNCGGGFDENGELLKGSIPKAEKYGIPWDYNYEDILQGKELSPDIEPDYGVNWEDDEGDISGGLPFFLPRLCNHCSDPACVSACENGAIFKREEDGIVLVDLDRCDGSRFCLSACPYKKIYFNPKIAKSEKCNFCFPLLERGMAPACAESCVGRARFVGYLDDEDTAVYKLVKRFKVALPLRGDFNTLPNVYYIPPFREVESFDEVKKVPSGYLEKLFGVEVYDVLEILKAESQKDKSEIIDILISYRYKENISPKVLSR